MEQAAAAAKAAREREQLFLRAASMGLLADVEALVAAGVDVSAVDEARAGALHLAAARGHADVIAFLVSHGADVDADDAAGRTALHVAALAAQPAAAEALQGRGAYVDATDADDATPLLLAARAGAGDIVRRLLRAIATHAAADKRGLTPLAHAVANDAPEAVEALLSAGADAAVTPHGYSLLHLACTVGAVRSARLLLSRGGGSVRDAANAARLTPAHAAALAGQAGALSLVLGWREGGAADVDARAADGKTPLDCIACLPPDAAEEATACEEVLRASGARRGAELPDASSASESATAAAEPADAALAAARAFAAMPRERQTRELERWATAVAAPDAPLPDTPLHDVAIGHLNAAGLLRRDAELDEVIARLLDDDTWQELMRDPAVRAAVDEVQADAKAVLKWGEQPACMAALGELRKLQAFCKPRGLKTSLPALLRGGDNTAAAARARMERKHLAARNALESARQAVLAHARGEDPEAAAALPEPAAAAVAPKPAEPAPPATPPSPRPAPSAPTMRRPQQEQLPPPPPLFFWPGWGELATQLWPLLKRQLLAMLATLWLMRALGMWSFTGVLTALQQRMAAPHAAAVVDNELAFDEL